MLRSAIRAAVSIASALNLQTEDAVLVNNSNRIVVRLLPCDVLARVAPAVWRADQDFEVKIAQRLVEADGPVAPPDARVDPCVYDRDGFAVTFWTYYEPLSPARLVAPAEYAEALKRMHSAMREIDPLVRVLNDGRVPHFIDRVAEAQRLVETPDQTPALSPDGRGLLRAALESMPTAIGRRNVPEQLLHGEPHLGNILTTEDGLLFIDLHSCYRGPIELDVAHVANPGSWDSEAVADYYPGLDFGLLRECRILMLAIVTAMRWDRFDELPNGRQFGLEWLTRLRVELDRYESEAPAG
jgi:hypothetical protein